MSLNEVTNASAFRLPRSWPQRRTASVFGTNIGGRRIEEGRNTRQGDSSRRNADAATPSKPLARVRLRERQRCVMSTAGLIHENCRRSCPKARFQSTRKCRRSPFPTRTYTRYLPTSMLLQRGNKIGRFRELDIGACNCLPQSPGNCCISLAIIHARRIHLTGELAPERQGFAQSTPDQITRVGMDVCSTYSPNALVIWNIFDECTS